MLRSKICQTGALLLATALCCGLLPAQMTVTGSITGTVVDPSGQVIPGAKVVIRSPKTGDSRIATSNGVGVFTLTAVQPDTYNLRVEQGGFKAHEIKGVVVSANERLSIGDVLLQIGEVTETVSVVGQVSQVQADSSEHSAVLTSNQLENLTARGRDVVSMLRTMPGVQYQADMDSVGGQYGTGTPSIGGAAAGTNVLAVDGVVSNDMGSPNVFSSVTTLDAIGEVKVVLNSYQAEYAGNGGAVVQVVTKSGGKEFHGGGYYFIRNEALNANDFFSNRNSVRRPRYRYNTFGATLGGPIYIPGKWNRDRSKLFGFYNLEQWGISVPGAVNSYTMPSALERQGDFSQTLDVSGKVIPINDPANGGQQFPGNQIPKSRQNPNGLALMNILPLPNFVNRAITGGNYNFQIQEVQDVPKRSQLFKIDYVPTDKDRFFVRGKTWLAQQQGYAVAGGSTPVGFFGQCYCFTESGLGVGGTHVFSPNIVMEYNAGVRHNHEAWYPYGSPNEINKVLRSGIGYTLGQWYPQANVSGYIPRFSFGGVPSAPNVSYDNRLLTGGTDFTFNLNDNLSITHGKHNIKLGWDIYRIREYEGEQSTFSGTFDFGKNTLNPLDTNYAFSNAALGVFNSYAESNQRYGANMRQTLIEWFAQDSWHATKKLSIDYGVRWTWSSEMHPNNPGQQSVFMRSLYQPGQAPPLYQPVTQNGTRFAQNPVTGALLPATYIGLFTPGTGNPAPGAATSGDKNVPQGFVNNPGVLWGPRLGFAYDVFGNGKTAIRGGGAILYNPRLSKWSNMVNNPPAIFTPITYYGDMRTFLQTAGTLSPSNTQGFNVNNKTPDNYNLTFGVQQDLGHGMVADASYLGVFGQHIPQTKQINTVPYGTHFLPSYTGGVTDNFYRPYLGYNNVAWIDNAYNSNYHALLFTLNRRFANNFQFGFTYTYSKFLNYTGIPVYRPLRTWSYGFDGADQTHNAVLNFTYNLPKVSKFANGNKLVKWGFDSWMLSGIAQWVSGSPAGIGFSTVQGTDLTGGGDGQRVNVVGNPNANGSTFYSWFNPAAFAVPGKNDPGNAAKNSVRNPGVNNTDLSLTKRFPVKGESRYFQLRWEAYNTFNHTQYSGMNTTARYDLNTGQQVNALFGQVTSTRAPRVMQGSLRFTF
jgi:hypothetical protein